MNTATTASATPNPTASPRTILQNDEVLIRMYSQGLGDCFLLMFPRTEGSSTDPVYVVIDCGVIAGTPDGPARMKKIVEDIGHETNGHIDLLILTHQHWDHLSGFLAAQEEWERITIDRLWTAWTELDDPHGLPGILQKILAKHQKALTALAARAVGLGLDTQQANAIELTAFVQGVAGVDVLPNPLNPAAAKRGVADAFNVIKDRFRTGDKRRQWACCEPGEVRPVPGTDVIAYVLGPPRDDKWLNMLESPGTTYDSPGTSAEKDEENSDAMAVTMAMRHMSEGRSMLNALAMPLLDPARRSAAEEADSAELDAYEHSFPFRAAVRVALPLAKTETDRKPEDYPALDSYFDENNDWRRIDLDWLNSSASLAIAADNLTNNTSLALAFELPAQDPKARKILLFVADAQVGNWLSWDTIPAWQSVEGAQPAQAGKPNIEELFSRAVFYKVGHHGSHNATLKAKGVERMPADGRMTAFVPVSVEVARQLKNWCRMPLDTMLDALSMRTHGKVVFPCGNFWPPIDDTAELATARKERGIEVAARRLGEKRRPKEAEAIEGEVPIWVQTRIPLAAKKP